MIERAKVGAAAGLDFLSLGDQHVTPTPYFQNVPMLARLVAVWPDNPKRQVGCLFLLPLWHPVLVAEQVATLSSLHPGRFILQTGIGGGAHTFAAMGASLRTRGRDIDESIRIIDALLAGEKVDSERFGLSRARISPVPEKPVEWWLGGHSDAALDRAARLGADLYIGPGSIESVRDITERFSHACDRHGTSANRVVARADVIVADRSVAAIELAEGIFDTGYRGMSMADVVVGDTATVSARFAALAELGVTDIAVRQMRVDQPVALRSIELLAEIRAQLA
ncbi:MAG: LLM class flavin-dependent oxidoreductase [Actinobacteria bacterium]|nr:LLM class flavin-dependent oxidoreductase [Actinomycetota bacterium]